MFCVSEYLGNLRYNVTRDAIEPLLKIWLPLTQGPRRWLKVIDARAKIRLISSIFRLLWHYVREHIIYTAYSDCVLVC